MNKKVGHSRDAHGKPGTRRWRRGSRGFALLLVIVASTIVFTLMIGFCYANALTVQVAGNIKDRGQARMIAESGMQMTMAAISGDPNWRTSRTPGTWVNAAAFGGGNLTITVQAGQDTNGDGIVEGSGSFMGNPSQPLTVTGSARFGRAVQTARAVIQPLALTMGVYAAGEFTVNASTVDSFDSRLGSYGGANVGSKAEVGTLSSANRAVSVLAGSKIAGDVDVPLGANLAQVVFVDSTSIVTGLKQAVPPPETMPALTAPTNLGPNTGDMSFEGNLAYTLSGNLHVNNLTIKSNYSIQISGHATIYVEGNFDMWNKSGLTLLPGATLDLYVKGSTVIYQHSPAMTVDGADLSRLRLYSLGTGSVTITEGTIFQGVIVAPKSDVILDGASDVSGAIIGKNVTIQGGTKFHEDLAITSGDSTSTFPGLGFIVTWLK